MENDAGKRHDIMQTTEIADLRTHLRNNLLAEFQEALNSKATLTVDQRQALIKLVTDDLVTSQAILKALNPVKKNESNE
jgi:hypothetical protein